MSAVLRVSTRSEPSGYVHKLRLSSRDGEDVAIRPAATQVGTRIIAKLIGVGIAFSAVIVWIGSRLS